MCWRPVGHQQLADVETDAPRADDGHAARHGLFRVDEFRFMAGARVDEAAGPLVGEGVVQARLVAADAGIDLVGAARGRLLVRPRAGGLKMPRSR